MQEERRQLSVRAGLVGGEEDGNVLTPSLLMQVFPSG